MKMKKVSENTTIVILVVVLAALALGWYSAFRQRGANYDGSIAACQRGELDRAANMQSWYASYRRAQLQATSAPTTAERTADHLAADTYLATTVNLMSRIDTAHSLTYDGKHPLGLGKFVCAQHYTKPSLFGNVI